MDGRLLGGGSWKKDRVVDYYCYGGGCSCAISACLFVDWNAKNPSSFFFFLAISMDEFSIDGCVCWVND